MDVAEFDYDLPDDLIAQAPPAERGASRLLVIDRAADRRIHTTVASLPEFLRAGDVLAVNNTKVFPARLIGVRDPSGGAVECLLLRRLDADRWDALVHPGQKLRPGSRMLFRGPGRTLRGEVLERRFHGRRTIRLWTDGPEDVDVDAIIDALGHVPLPPYIKRADEASDRERYQTVYARRRGSVAAPTAGLHLTDALLAALAARGVERVAVTLHVGYGTFKPVRAERVEDHLVDAERFEVDDQAAGPINRALREGRRIVAVGTTTARTLETLGREGCPVRAGTGWTDLFIYPGFQFRIVSVLMTNFHLPRSSLLMLVCAFGGRERVLAAYAEAVARGYRFYSYGDAMLIV